MGSIVATQTAWAGPSRTWGDAAAPAPAIAHQRMLPLRDQRWLLEIKGPGRPWGNQQAKIAQAGALSKHRKSRLLREAEIKGAAQKGKVIFISAEQPQTIKGGPLVTRRRRWEPAHGGLAPPTPGPGAGRMAPGLLVRL